MRARDIGHNRKKRIFKSDRRGREKKEFLQKGMRKRLRGVQETADTEIEGKIQRIQIKRKRERDRWKVQQRRKQNKAKYLTL